MLVTCLSRLRSAEIYDYSEHSNMLTWINGVSRGSCRKKDVAAVYQNQNQKWFNGEATNVHPT